MKRIICVFLCVLFLSALFVGCSAPKGRTVTTTAESGNGEVISRKNMDDVPEDLKFGGEEIWFAIAEAQNGNFSERSIGVEEYSGNMVDEAIYSRNMKIEERLGLKLGLREISGYKNFSQTVEPALSVGDDTYDILCGYQYFDIMLALKGYIADMKTFDADCFGYVDITKEYWPTTYINNLNYKDSLYWVTGDISLRYTSGFYCTFVNKAKYNAGIQGTFGSIFDVVESGAWSFEQLAQMSRAAFVDTNSNSICDEDDEIGLIVEKGNSSTKTALAVGAAIEMSKKDSNGDIALLFNSSNEHLIGVIQSMDGILRSEYIYQPSNSDDDTAMKLFASGKSLFTMSKIYNAENYLLNMEDDYYIIPMPKFEASQQNYRTLMHDGVNLFGISHSSAHKAESAALLEVLAAETYQKVVPVYYDNALKNRYTHDVNSSKMIDQIRDGVYIDFVMAWDNQVTANWLRGSISDNPTGALKRFEGSWQQNLEKLLLALSKLNIYE